jgi:hypothetical protein
VAGCCEHGNESSGSIKGGGDFLNSSVTVRFPRGTATHGAVVS